jgi:hypothetical protein
MEVVASKFRNAAGVLDGRLRDPWGTPYAIFGSTKSEVANGDYNDQVVFVNYLDPANTVRAYRGPASGYNKGSIQIISAGPNAKFGRGGLYTPGLNDWLTTGPGGDDLSNFKSYPLASDND